MKKLFTFLLLCIFAQASAQLAMRTDKKEILDRFKATETIFVLSNSYDTKVYEDILKDSWTVTPFKVMKIDDFNPALYMDGKYSFAMLDGNMVVKKSATYFHSYMAFFMFDMEDKLKEIEKYKAKPEKKRNGYDIMREHRISIASFLLYKNEAFLKNNNPVVISSGASDFGSANFRHVKFLGHEMYRDNIFHNYKPGFLKNYFQKINSLITDGKGYGMFGGDCTPEIKALKKATLYVPEYVGVKFNAFTMQESDKKEEDKIKLFEDYKYKYEYIDTDVLSDKIMAGEEIYYLRYAMENGQKYLHIVNSKTGDVIYKNYHPMSYNLNSGNIEEIKKAIEKGKV